MGQTGAKGIVAAGHKLTAEAVADVLRQGGNAFDGAIAGLAMACVCEPVLCSPGGGGFAMLRDSASGKVSLIDFFAQTPKERRQRGDDGVCEIHADFGETTQAFHIGPATTACPGFYDGIEQVHSHGRGMPLSDLFAAAVTGARSGVVVTPYQHYLSTVGVPILTASPAARDLFAPGGEPPGAGEAFSNPGLADCLEELAAGGLTSSPVEAAMVAEQAVDGHWTAEGLRQ